MQSCWPQTPREQKGAEQTRWCTQVLTPGTQMLRFPKLLAHAATSHKHPTHTPSARTLTVSPDLPGTLLSAPPQICKPRGDRQVTTMLNL